MQLAAEVSITLHKHLCSSWNLWLPGELCDMHEMPMKIKHYKSCGFGQKSSWDEPVRGSGTTENFDGHNASGCRVVAFVSIIAPEVSQMPSVWTQGHNHVHVAHNLFILSFFLSPLSSSILPFSPSLPSPFLPFFPLFILWSWEQDPLSHTC